MMCLIYHVVSLAFAVHLRLVGFGSSLRLVVAEALVNYECFSRVLLRPDNLSDLEMAHHGQEEATDLHDAM